MDSIVDSLPDLWVGWYDFSLEQASGQGFDIEVKILPDEVSFWLHEPGEVRGFDVSLAIVDRMMFRRWLHNPGEPLVRHDMVWRRETTGFCLDVDFGLAQPRGICTTFFRDRRHSQVSSQGTLLPAGGEPVAPRRGVYSYAVPGVAIRFLMAVI